ncbi:MAG: hypothetical protein A3F84_00255 [Candidatus Handelsmanbacteria bacterium RIFCSPLOWO2_12_FULL_64_10]|uniref:GWxTD domain-containing protein n=1 Tax=Handelsmanbacteria sp. (strain RIFCSPLOWO2_12_FULL_64_10) TaxID=1817868 RepID=A0A1F6CCD5_HANXR|nr:MAG: hypothetical protein A3F84_00255 [Candidatus Handelsmanbacteria bacterium RIFCSPLOWO2_12_FULL_64_10]
MAVGEAEVARAPRDARAHVRLGRLYLDAGRGREALRAFQKAVSLDKNLADAYNGIGLYYMSVKKDWKAASRYFNMALDRDWAHKEAQLNLALMHVQMGNYDTREAAERVLKIDPNHAPAYLMLGRWHEQREEYGKALEYYRKYVALQPDDVKVGYEVALNLLKLGRFEEAEAFVATSLHTFHRYGVLAQVFTRRGDYEKALQAFELYIEGLDEGERAVYRDLSLVASAAEVWAYQGTPEVRRPAFLRRFWLRHDPTLVTGGARRQAEHYRRVWHARAYFGEKKFPWDRRGEVYVRYGEPDYRSSSKDINLEAPPAVRRVQERIAYELYRDRAVGVTFTGPIFPVQIDRSVEMEVRQAEEGTESPDPEVLTATQMGIAGQDTLGLSRWRPMVMGMDPGRIPWEVWVYTGIEDGIEVVFTDQNLSGVFDYAPTPTPGAEDFRRLRGPGELSNLLATFNRHAPGVVVQRAVSTTPEHYNVARGAEPIQFSYDVADFRGPEGTTRTEVYAAIPLGQLSPASTRDTALVVERIAALADSAFDRVYRSRDQMVYAGEAEAGAVLMDQADLLVPPGQYTLAVQVQQKGTKRMQVYRRPIRVEAYPPGSLKLSDLQVARGVSPAKPGETRFVKQGWKVSPAPGRSFYEGQAAFLYFEVYNLRQDDQGHTRFEVSYSVSGRQTRPLVVRALSGLGRLLGTEGAGEVTFRHERAGSEGMDADYVELDLRESGAGEYLVRVTVRDLLSGTGAQKETTFRVVPGR